MTVHRSPAPDSDLKSAAAADDPTVALVNGLARLLVLAIFLTGVLWAGGCRKPLLAADEERSQYDRFDAVRSQRAPPYIEDEFGFKRPNLRGRLLAKD